uniref:Uncharacterized protein n=1 Tax=Chromera velia CCMP2878 TaxID=1169474 RepID=A0A0G4G6I0_9ALVE|eukprot:Cvel_20489.t1-p1 / transcript=Cvel_20489.t1 / gene=Cvel_20489 / organism=Chromera_velia_CCMP2878 / gene_product=hypothetical protein / transcript_product=hypothetical protein / location=Cvel_scaffold1842:27019-33788(+) / protein_length=1035 / sequence_SO=supercontig / SO=protein_coding / is_pseudo=false
MLKRVPAMRLVNKNVAQTVEKASESKAQTISPLRKELEDIKRKYPNPGSRRAKAVLSALHVSLSPPAEVGEAKLPPTDLVSFLVALQEAMPRQPKAPPEAVERWRRMVQSDMHFRRILSEDLPLIWRRLDPGYLSLTVNKLAVMGFQEWISGLPFLRRRLSDMNPEGLAGVLRAFANLRGEGAEAATEEVNALVEGVDKAVARLARGGSILSTRNAMAFFVRFSRVLPEGTAVSALLKVLEKRVDFDVKSPSPLSSAPGRNPDSISSLSLEEVLLFSEACRQVARALEENTERKSEAQRFADCSRSALHSLLSPSRLDLLTNSDFSKIIASFRNNKAGGGTETSYLYQHHFAESLFKAIARREPLNYSQLPLAAEFVMGCINNRGLREGDAVVIDRLLFLFGQSMTSMGPSGLLRTVTALFATPLARTSPVLRKKAMEEIERRSEQMKAEQLFELFKTVKQMGDPNLDSQGRLLLLLADRKFVPKSEQLGDLISSLGVVASSSSFSDAAPAYIDLLVNAHLQRVAALEGEVKTCVDQLKGMGGMPSLPAGWEEEKGGGLFKILGELMESTESENRELVSSLPDSSSSPESVAVVASDDDSSSLQTQGEGKSEGAEEGGEGGETSIEKVVGGSEEGAETEKEGDEVGLRKRLVSLLRDLRLRYTESVVIWQRLHQLSQSSGIPLAHSNINTLAKDLLENAPEEFGTPMLIRALQMVDEEGAPPQLVSSLERLISERLENQKSSSKLIALISETTAGPLRSQGTDDRTGSVSSASSRLNLLLRNEAARLARSLCRQLREEKDGVTEDGKTGALRSIVKLLLALSENPAEGSSLLFSAGPGDSEPKGARLVDDLLASVPTTMPLFDGPLLADLLLVLGRLLGSSSSSSSSGYSLESFERGEETLEGGGEAQKTALEDLQTETARQIMRLTRTHEGGAGIAQNDLAALAFGCALLNFTSLDFTAVISRELSQLVRASDGSFAGIVGARGDACSEGRLRVWWMAVQVRLSIGWVVGRSVGEHVDGASESETTEDGYSLSP